MSLKKEKLCFLVQALSVSTVLFVLYLGRIEHDSFRKHSPLKLPQARNVHVSALWTVDEAVSSVAFQNESFIIGEFKLHVPRNLTILSNYRDSLE